MTFKKEKAATGITIQLQGQAALIRIPLTIQSSRSGRPLTRILEAGADPDSGCSRVESGRRRLSGAAADRGGGGGPGGGGRWRDSGFGGAGGGVGDGGDAGGERQRKRARAGTEAQER